MKVTYIHHSSFLAELDSVYLLFDYYKGTVPPLAPEKPLYVFASHAHGDHFSRAVFDLRRGGPVTYVLSDDIKRRDAEDVLREKEGGETKETPGGNHGGRSLIRVKAGEMLRLGLPGKTEPLKMEAPAAGSGGRPQDAAPITVETFRSTDAGVAFWVRADGRDIYHAGDLNNWWWEGEDKAWNHNMAANYRREIEKMRGRCACAAFVPLDPRQGEQYCLGMDEFARAVNADHIFPMHFWEDYGIIEKMIENPVSAPYRDRIEVIHREGEEFII